MRLTRQAMTRPFAILVTLLMVVIPAKADVALWLRPVSDWTVIQVYGVIKAGDLATFQRYTENVDPAATLVIVTGPGGNLSAGIGMGVLVHQKKLIVGAKGMCASSCALLWMGGETGRKFIYRDQGTGLCFHQASNPVAGPPGYVLPRPSSGPGNALIGKYLTH
jgi:ATP-dependent protease ClpP protease subunit